jgi:hypothetical protein
MDISLPGAALVLGAVDSLEAGEVDAAERALRLLGVPHVRCTGYTM